MSGRRFSESPVPPPPRAIITVHDEKVTIALIGEIDRFNVALLFAELRSAVTARPAVRVVVDLERVDFCDVGGVRALVGLATAAAEHGSTLRVRNVPSAVEWLIRRLGVAQQLHLDGARP